MIDRLIDVECAENYNATCTQITALCED